MLGWLRRQARRRGVVDGRGGAVAVVQRFGAALNLNVHIHALALDGVFAPDGGDGVSFHAHVRHDDDVGPLLVIVQRRIERLLQRRGVPDGREGFDAPDRWSEDAPALAGLAAASVEGVVALGPRAGARVRRWGDRVEMPAPPPIGRWHARQQGFDLHAGIVVPAGSRDRLERLCRYALRPPVGQDRLQLMPDGTAVLDAPPLDRWHDAPGL
ncbi:MAG: transposase [Vicinamibacterales bacterium]